MSLDYSEIVPNLYLGNAASQKNYCKPQKATCCLTFGLRDTGAPKWAAYYCFCELEDRAALSPDRVMYAMERGAKFIEDNLSNGVLVHCGLGVSRSAACVCYYLMRSRALNYDQALEFVRSRRECVNPNEGFARVLRNY